MTSFLGSRLICVNARTGKTKGMWLYDSTGELSLMFHYCIFLQGKFSSKSDVWSFAVTLWEILTFAREQPLDKLSDEQVIENCGHYYRGDNTEVYLPPPGNCPKEIYDLMRECWNRDEVTRPAFREIHMFLSGKTWGTTPRTIWWPRPTRGRKSPCLLYSSGCMDGCRGRVVIDL